MGIHKEEGTLIKMVSGGVGGFCVVAVGYPFDLIKTRLQIAIHSEHRPPILAELSTTVRQIWRTGGLRGFYQGSGAPLIGVTPIFAANFWGFEVGKRIWDWGGLGEGEIRRNAFGAFYSALQTAAVVIPAERVKVYMQMTNHRHMTVRATVVHLMKVGGLRELYRGGLTTLCRDVPGLMTFLTSYEWYKSLLIPKTSQKTKTEQMVMVMLAGGLAGMTSWMISLPSDVIKSRLQSTSEKPKGKFPAIAILYRLLREEGIGALYRGWVPVMLRAFPANAACFLGYEATQHMLRGILDNE